MLTRLSVGRVEPWELVLSVGAARRDDPGRRRRSRSGSTARACCSTGSGPGCARTWRRRAAASAADPASRRGDGCDGARGAPGRRTRTSLARCRPATSPSGDPGATPSTDLSPRRAAAAAGSARRPARMRRSGPRLRASPTGGVTAPGGERRDEPPEPARDPGQVRARPLAGQDAGDALGRGRLVERPALAGDRGHGHDLVARPEHLPEQSRGAGASGAESSDRPSRCEQVEREVGDRPAAARRRAAGPARRRRPGRSRRRRRARRRAPPTGRRPGPRARRAPAAPAARVPAPSTSAHVARCRRRSAGPMNASARSPPHDGSKRWASESNGSASGRGSIGRSVAGRFGSTGTSGSSRSDSWSRIVARW